MKITKIRKRIKTLAFVGLSREIACKYLRACGYEIAEHADDGSIIGWTLQLMNLPNIDYDHVVTNSDGTYHYPTSSGVDLARAGLCVEADGRVFYIGVDGRTAYGAHAWLGKTGEEIGQTSWLALRELAAIGL